MPPKRTIEKEDILAVAYQLAIQEGVSTISARKVANELGTSVAPIYSHFKSIEDLQADLVIKISQEAEKMIEEAESESYFQKIGLASIHFAKKYPKLVLDIIYHGDLYDEFHNINDHKFIVQMKEEAEFKNWSEPLMHQLLLKVELFQMGLTLYQAQHPEVENLDNLLIEVGSEFYQIMNPKG